MFFILKPLQVPEFQSFQGWNSCRACKSTRTSLSLSPRESFDWKNSPRIRETKELTTPVLFLSLSLSCACLLSVSGYAAVVHACLLLNKYPQTYKGSFSGLDLCDNSLFRFFVNHFVIILVANFQDQTYRNFLTMYLFLVMLVATTWREL